jgi:hypothetical protein
MRNLLVIVFCTSLCAAQTAHQSSPAVEGNVYEIPFPAGINASEGNIIELSVANSSALTVNQVKVELTSTIAGLKFTEKSAAIASINAKEEQTTSFIFSVDKSAQVNKEQTLSFTITDKTGQKWTKDIKVKIAPPRTYELFQNYPNPFNPTTVICYQLPGEVGTQYIVSLRVYDIIGREVANLINEQQEPGYYQKTFDASRYASGMYIYRLIAKDEQNKQHTFVKKMLMLK